MCRDLIKANLNLHKNMLLFYQEVVDNMHEHILGLN